MTAHVHPLPAAKRRSEAAVLVPALAAAAFLIAFGALHYGFYTKKLLMDTPIYERYGDAVVDHGLVPYRDFGVEYPPGALPVFAAPSLATPAGDFLGYARVFEGLMLLCGAAAAALVGLILARRGSRTVAVAAGTLLAGLAPLALGPVVLSRFDLWPALLAIAALAALVADRRRTAFALLGAATAAKLYPAVLLPLALAYVWRRRGRREAAVCAAVGVGVVVAAFLPFVVASPGGVWASLAGQATRPMQIESLGAAALLAAHQLWGLPLTEVASHGSDNLAGGLPAALAAVQSLLEGAALAAVWVGFARGPATRDRLLRYSAAAVCAFVALNRVLSPQYLIWLFALVPLVRGRRGVLAGTLFLAAMVLTQLWFPYHYIGLVYGLDPRASWLVLARDLLLVALLLALVWPARSARRTGGALVAVLAAGALAAAGAAASSSPRQAAATHGGLLVESGTASRCDTRSAAPAVTSGTVAYAASGFVNPSRRPACVTVSLTASPRTQVFSAAYRGRFDSADLRTGYLGDAGRCSNVPGVASRRLAYSFEVPARSRFAVEVEDCGSSGVLPPYVLDVHGGGTRRVLFGSASARKRGGRVVVRWTATRAPAGTTFTVFREQAGALVATPGAPTSRPDGAYAQADPAAPGGKPLRYWIRATTASGSWSWHGPVPADS